VQTQNFRKGLKDKADRRKAVDERKWVIGGVLVVLSLAMLTLAVYGYFYLVSAPALTLK
jgi:hypothetical protein